MALTSCVQYPEPYRPPIQRQPTGIVSSDGLRHYIALRSPEARLHVVKDVILEDSDSPWRWTYQEPTFRFRLPATGGLKFCASIVVLDQIFAQTGPVHITVFVEGHKLGTLAVEKPGEYSFSKEVTAEWLTTEYPVVASLVIDKVWVSPEDGARRGFILTEVGFRQ
jgi:hypothetical protein